MNCWPRSILLDGISDKKKPCWHPLIKSAHGLEALSATLFITIVCFLLLNYASYYEVRLDFFFGLTLAKYDP